MVKLRKSRSLSLNRQGSSGVEGGSLVEIDFDSSSRNTSSNSTFKDEPDLEDPLENLTLYVNNATLQDQSNRLTELLLSKTEMAGFDPSQPKSLNNSLHDDFMNESEDDTGGFHYWVHQVRGATEHGGDYKTRLVTAARAALGSGLTFACLVLPDRTSILGAVWVGNIWMHVNISDSLGASLPSVILFARSILFTTLFTWPIAFFLNYLHAADAGLAATILFPCLIFIVSFLILTSPQLTQNNLMLVVMYIVLANPMTSKYMIWWKPFGWVGTYFICLAIALLMNIFPFPNFALKTTSKSLKRLEKDLTMLLLACKTYSNNNGTNLKIARQAISTIEFMHTRICETVGTLKKKLPATKVELLLMKCQGGQTAGRDLEEWVSQTEKLLQPLQMLRSAVMQKVLGEESNLSSPKLARAKVLINHEITPSRDRVVNAMIAAIAVCHAWADPSEHRRVLPDVQGELQAALEECRQAFHRTMCMAASTMGASQGTDKNHYVPLFAHLTRRMSSFHSLFELADSLLRYLESHSWEQEEIKGSIMENDSSFCFCLPAASDLVAFFTQPWAWNNQDKLRLALKTSVGMVFASFFVCVPYLKDLATPYGLWPGITIASVNLSTTGSSFHKAADRLMATLVAAAFAMLIADLFPGHHDIVKILALTVFTFVVIYLRDAKHAYMYTYSAISIGCMLFGSQKTDYDIAGYIPKRIELIFIGIMIFAAIELLMFPRSSRKIVEQSTFDFVLSMRNFFNQAVECSQRMEQYVVESKKETWKSDGQTKDEQNYTMTMFQENEDPFHLNILQEKYSGVKALSDKLKKEIDSALAEPCLGLALPLHPESFRGLVLHESSSEMQAALLCNALNKLAGYYQKEGHPIRESDWPHVHTVFLKEAANNMETICQWLNAIFADGRIRAQRGNSVKAVSAVSSFRSLEDVRLKIVSDWSASFSLFVSQNGFEGSDPVAIMTLGITTTVILELIRHMQKAGKNMEEIAYRFPTFQ